MSGRKEPEFVVQEHWKGEDEREQRENLEKILQLWKSMSREAAEEEG